MRCWVVIAVIVGCAPAVDGPVERAHARDRVDEARLATQLSALPGVVRAEVMLRRAVRDPLGAANFPPPTATVVAIVDDRADRAEIRATARVLARAVAPEVEPVIVVEIGAIRPSLATLGPFTIEAGSRGPLRAALAIGLAMIVGLAGWIAVRERRFARR